MARQRFQDLGFGTTAAEALARLINRDGSFNVRRNGLSFFTTFSSYHYLIQISWWKFNALILISYILINAFFGAIYFAIGTGGLNGVDGVSLSERYLQSVFFSTQTFTTVGFGRIAPVSTLANITSAFESLAGLLSFALATGLLYGRFSRPVARIIFSHHGIITSFQDMTGFMFRIANQRTNQLIDVSATVTLSRLEEIGNGRRVRRFHELDLERDRVNFFHLSWTVVHPIDTRSPLFGVTKQQLDDSDAEFLIIIKAFDDTFSTTVHTRTSYKSKEVIFNGRFKPIIRTAPDGITEIDLDKIHDYDLV